MGGVETSGAELGVKLVTGTSKIKNKTRHVLAPRKQNVLQNKKSNHSGLTSLADSYTHVVITD